MKNLVEIVRENVGELVDPETGLTFSEMRLIQDAREIAQGVVRVDFKPSSPICPIALKMAMNIKETVLGIEGVREAFVYCHGHMIEQTINDLVNPQAADSHETFKGIEGQLRSY